MTTEVVVAKRRLATGKGASHADRRAGLVPLVFYGEGTEKPVHLVAQRGAIEKLLTGHGEGSRVTLRIEGEAEYPAMIKEVQYHPVRGDVIHVDFQGISLTKKIRAELPIVLKGTPQGVKEGGVLQYQLREVEVEALPQDLPEHITADISGLGIGDVLFVRDLEVPPAVKVLTEGGEVIATVLAPTKEEEAEPAEAPEAPAEDGQAAEGKTEE
ncbi:MAG: large subunit ribosomal protein [Bacillota bacterium]|jgi:large subunit ribosomal protein L25|nr:large subunit ribosomal protein [Bacillota bacterium]MDK2881855.1 large subunit ribosomal protein [Bacillota bacterium]MDK2960118.1 large subunit ribosomal protein [Bacillota bacterium]